MIMTMGSTNVLGQYRKSKREPTAAELRVKYERLNTSMERVRQLKKRGYMPKAIEEARKSVEIAEKDFGPTSTTVIRPIMTLAELQGKRRHFDEAEESFEKIYTIIASGDEADIVYGIAYRIAIARLYLKWNNVEKAEATLLKAQLIIDLSGHYFGHYTKSIKKELRNVEAWREANSYSIKRK